MPSFLVTLFINNIKSQIITGKITDTVDGTPLFGAIVKVKETNITTKSDIDGRLR